MAEAMGVDVSRVYVRVFTLGVALGTVGGALVIPATAAVNEMGIDLIVEAFAVVVIGGLGCMRRALPGAPRPRGADGGGVPTPPQSRALALFLIRLARPGPPPPRRLSPPPPRSCPRRPPR